MFRFISRHFPPLACCFAALFYIALPSLGRAQTTMLPAQQPSTASPMAQEIASIQKVVDRWDDARNQQDQYGLELVLAPQFINISDTGQVTDRDQQVSEMLRKGAPQFTLTQKIASVRVLGDTAVANGTYDRAFKGSRLSHTGAKDEKGVFSQVYVRTRDSWQCINSQRTLLAPEKSSKKKSNSADSEDREKPLGHPLGLSFPGFHKHDNPPPSPPPQ